MMAGQFVGPCRLAARHGTTSSNPISSSGESGANSVRTSVATILESATAADSLAVQPGEHRTSLREVLPPQIGRPLCRVFAFAGDTWPQRVIAADLLHEELGARRRAPGRGGLGANPDASGERRLS